jgi:hypothetical protein
MINYIIMFVVCVVFPTNAYAYLDPGTGSLIIQATIASVAAMGYIIKIYWNKIVGFFLRKKNVQIDGKKKQ